MPPPTIKTPSPDPTVTAGRPAASTGRGPAPGSHENAPPREPPHSTRQTRRTRHSRRPHAAASATSPLINSTKYFTSYQASTQLQKTNPACSQRSLHLQKRSPQSFTRDRTHGGSTPARKKGRAITGNPMYLSIKLLYATTLFFR